LHGMDETLGCQVSVNIDATHVHLRMLALSMKDLKFQYKGKP